MLRDKRAGSEGEGDADADADHSAKRARLERVDTVAPTDNVVVIEGESLNDSHKKFKSVVAEMWLEEGLCDVVLAVGDRRFPAHRVILSAASKFMRACLAGNFAEADQPLVNVTDISPDVFLLVLSFVYNNHIHVSESKLTALLEAACRFDVDVLQAKVEMAIADRLTPDNCLDAWKMANRMSAHILQDKAKSVAMSKFDDVARSAAVLTLSSNELAELVSSNMLVVNGEDVVFRTIEAWVNAQSPPPEMDVVTDLLGHVRVAHMKNKTILQESPLANKHSSVFLSAYAEIVDKKKTIRTRHRTLCVPPLEFDDLCKGLRVRVKADLAFVEKECKGIPPDATEKVGWNSDMKNALGEVFTVGRRTDTCLMGAKLDTKDKQGMTMNFIFPYTVLELVMDDSLDQMNSSTELT